MSEGHGGTGWSWNPVSLGLLDMCRQEPLFSIGRNNGPPQHGAISWPFTVRGEICLARWVWPPEHSSAAWAVFFQMEFFDACHDGLKRPESDLIIRPEVFQVVNE